MNERINTLDALLGRVIDLDAQKRDVVADTRRMGVAVVQADEAALSGLVLNVDDDNGNVMAFAMNDHAQRQLSTDLGIPARYFDRMRNDAPDLLVENAHHWLWNEPNRRLIRGYGDTGRAWLSDRYRRLDHIEIARTLLPEFEKLGTDIEFHHAAVTDNKLYLRAVLPRLQGEIKVGQTVQWGVEIRNSEVGDGTLSIAGFILTLECTNGMTVSRDLNRRHVGRRIEIDGLLSDEAREADDSAFWLVARDVLRNTITETRFDEVVAQLRDAANSTPIVRPIKATEVLAQRVSLTEDEREQVLGHLISGGDLSRWGALSAITRAAQDVSSFDRQAELEETGWALATMSENEWDRIATTR